MAGALLDADEAYAYYLAQSPQAAYRFVEAYDNRLAALERQWQYEVVRDGLRIAPVDGFPYYVIYRVLEEEGIIRIISVKHEKSAARPYRD